MSFGDAIRICFGRYFQFSGRATRPEFWWFALFLFLGGTVLGLIDDALFGTEATPFMSPLANLFGLATFIPSLSVGFRRLQDTGRTGWLFLLPTILAVATFAFLFSTLLAVFGTSGGTVDATTAPTLTSILGPLLWLLLVATFVMFVLTIWWLTRPTEPGPNRYGPMPA